jgi:hypothetical protein
MVFSTAARRPILKDLPLKLTKKDLRKAPTVYKKFLEPSK